MFSVSDNQSQSTFVDIILWSLFAALLGFSLYLHSQYSDISMAFKLIFVFFLIFILLAIAFFTKKGRIAYYFAQESLVELHKVVWPSRSEVVQVTWMVSGVIVLISLFLWGIDSAFSALISYVAA